MVACALCIHSFTHIQFAWHGFGSGGLKWVASWNSCRKFSPYPAETALDSSKADHCWTGCAHRHQKQLLWDKVFMGEKSEQRRVRNSPAYTKVSRAGQTFPSSPWWRPECGTASLQPTKAQGGADIHLQPLGECTPEQLAAWRRRLWHYGKSML